MKVVIDIECNSLVSPSKIWLILCKDIDTGEYHVFKTPSDNADEALRFLQLASQVSCWVGHNWLEYDYPILNRLLHLEVPSIADRSFDTLILSRLFDYTGGAYVLATASHPSRSVPVEVSDLLGDTNGHVKTRAHSIEAYGEAYGIPKGKFTDFTKYSDDMLEYCKRDVDICHRIYLSFLSRISNPAWLSSIRLEQEFQHIVNALHSNGFAFNVTKGNKLLEQVLTELGKLDKEIGDAFPPRLKLVKEISPRLTKFGTLNKADFRWVRSGDLSEYNGGPFCRCEWQAFNASSHKQVIKVLGEASWAPTEKTSTHINTEREIRKIKTARDKKSASELEEKLINLKLTGWKINETNLSTLPPQAPKPARLLAKRILLESRRRTLVEWLNLVQDDGRIHGRFYGIGAWTHRMAHQQPNTANIPNEYDTQGNKKLLGKDLRALWRAPPKRLLVGVDAEGIQLRIFAHYINDAEFTDALVKGKKSDKTDPHSLNQKILGDVCKSRAAAKRFIYALLLGAGLWKLSQILECSEQETKAALDRLLRRYTGWAKLKTYDIPRDAKRGYFIGLDGREVMVPGEDIGTKKHLMMSGYLQNGESVIMKLATLEWHHETGINRVSFGEKTAILIPGTTTEVSPSEIKPVNLVHDEWQTETPNNMATALWVAECQSRALRKVGQDLKLRCPLDGSYYNEDLKDYTIGTNWSVTH